MEKRFRVLHHTGQGDFDPQAYYEFRMEYQKRQVSKLLEHGKITQTKADGVFINEENNRQAHIHDLSIIEKLNKDIAVIVPTYWGQKPWLRACLESLRKLGYFILLAYDNHFWAKQTTGHMFPSCEVMQMADAVSMKHKTLLPNLGISYLWDQLYGLRLLKGFGFPYVLSINGDCIMEKPENFPKIVKLLGDADIICSEYVVEREYCGTVAMLAKTDMFLAYFDEFLKEFMAHKWTLEKRLYKYIHDNGYKCVPVRNSAHNYKMPDPNATWCKKVGLRHLHAEQMIRKQERLLPVEKKFFDFGENFDNIPKDGPLHRYYMTDDPKHLEEWWGPLT
jgi:hypothetical protein